MKIERWFPTPDLAAAFIQGVEVFAPELGCNCSVDGVEVYTKEAKSFGPYEAWVVKVDIYPKYPVTGEPENFKKTEKDTFNKAGWERRALKDYYPAGSKYKSFLQYVRKFIEE